MSLHSRCSGPHHIPTLNCYGEWPPIPQIFPALFVELQSVTYPIMVGVKTTPKHPQAFEILKEPHIGFQKARFFVSFGKKIKMGALNLVNSYGP